MSHSTIEHEIRIEATPEIVFDVVSNPKHLAGWFPDEAELDPVAGGAGVFTFHTPDGEHVAPVTVVDARPYSLFSFRWSQDAGEAATEGNSLVVRFELESVDGGTLLRMTESNFDGRGLSDAQVLADYDDHTQGWGQIMPRLAPYAETLVAHS
ncbi:MAG: activator of ATPase [Aeromicrobium sp.]|nr:activator of ATPase [Aeromicrobium sp.]